MFIDHYRINPDLPTNILIREMEFTQRLYEIAEREKRTIIRYADGHIEYVEETQQQAASANIPLAIATDKQTGDTITVSDDDLYKGTYILGVQGSGKTSILTQIGLHQIESGNSIIAFDPTTNMSMIKDIVSRMPEERVKDTYIFSLTDDFKFPFGLPVFSYKTSGTVGYQEKQATREQIFTAFEKIWKETKEQVHFRKVLRYIIPVLLEHPKFTLAHIPAFFADDKFRAKVLASILDTDVKRFWEDFKTWSKERKTNETNPFLTRVDDLLHDGYIQYHISQKPQKGDGRFEKRLIDFDWLIEQKKIVLIHLPLWLKGYKQAGRVIGILFMMQIYAAIFGGKGNQVTVLVDEFAKWAIGSADDFRELLSYGRKYGVQLVLANQYIDQFKEEGVETLISAVTTAATVISMRLNRDDAKYMAALYEGYRDDSEDFPDFEEELYEEDDYEEETYEDDEQFTKQPSNLYADVFSQLERHESQVCKDFARIWLPRLNDLANENTQPDPYAEGTPSLVKEYAKFSFMQAGVERWWPYHPGDIEDYLEKLNQYFYGAQKYRDEDYAIAYEMGEKLVEAMLHYEKTRYPDGRYHKEKSELWEALEIPQFIRSVEQVVLALIADPLYIDEADIDRERRDFERDKEQRFIRWQQQQQHNRERWQQREEHKRELYQREQTRKRERWEEKREEWEEERELDEEVIAKLLKDFPVREGFIKTSSGVHLMRTIDLPEKTTDNVEERIKSILTRTKYTYCRGKKEVEEAIKTAFNEPPDSGSPTSPPTPPQPPTQPSGRAPAPESIHDVDDLQQRSDRLDQYEGLDDF